MRTRLLFALILLGPGLHVWSQVAGRFAEQPSAGSCPAGPLPVDTVWNHQVVGAPFFLIGGGSDGMALMEGDFLASGGRQIWALSIYGRLQMFQSDGTQAPGFPMNINSQCFGPAACMWPSYTEAALPLDDTGQYACSVRYRRQPWSSSDGTHNFRFIRPDTSFFPWSFDTLTPNPTPSEYNWEVQEVTGLRAASGRWGVFGTNRRSYNDTQYPITPAMRMVDAQGKDYPGWPKYGVPGYTIRGISSVENALVFPAGRQPTIFPSLVISNYGLAMTGDGVVKLGFPIPFPYSPPFGSTLSATNCALATRVNGLTYNVFQVNQEFGSGMCGVHLYSENGIEKPGWPVRPYYTDSSTNRFVGGCPSEGFAFGDLDGDGVPELVVIADGSVDNTLGLFAWHLDGTPAAGFPVAIPGTASRGQPVIGDIDGDGKPEIVFSAYVYCAIGPTNPAMLFAYHSDGTVVKGFPMDYSGLGDPGSLSTPILDDFNGDGKVDIITTPDRSSGWIYVTTLNGTYSRDTIEWPMDKFDVMRTGWYRKMAHVDRAASWLTASAAAIPGDGISSTWIIAHGIRPNSQPILLPDQFVRFGRLPDLNGGEFSTFQDNANGSWSQKLTAPNIEDPVTVTVSGWINEFKLNQTIPVTFWGKPRMNSINPRIFPTGWFTNSTITGANFGSGVTLRALSPDLRIANATRVSETGMTARFSVSGRALSGPRYFVANAYGRDSAPQWVLAYGPHDLFLMMDKTAGTTASWVGLASSNYKLLRDTAPSFPAPSTIYTGPAKSFADPASGSYFYLVIP